jgi:hypothetical protein
VALIHRSTVPEPVIADVIDALKNLNDPTTESANTPEALSVRVAMVAHETESGLAINWQTPPVIVPDVTVNIVTLT